MKVLYKARNDGYVLEMHFSCELPLFPRARQMWWICHRVLSRRTRVWDLAQQMARENRGRFVVELGDPQRTFAEFLQELLTLPGVDRVQDAQRYSLVLEVGRAFDRDEVARKVAECVRRYFYPEERLEMVPLKEDEEDQDDSEVIHLRCAPPAGLGD